MERCWGAEPQPCLIRRLCFCRRAVFIASLVHPASLMSNCEVLPSLGSGFPGSIPRFEVALFSSLGVAIAISSPLAPSSRWVASHVQGHHRGLSGQGKDRAFLCCGFNTGELWCSDSNCEHVGWAILGPMSHAGRTLETLRKQAGGHILHLHSCLPSSAYPLSL